MGSEWVVLMCLVVLGHSLPLIPVVNRDKMYLPDQFDYLKVWSANCETDNLIYWPQDGQCYPESSRGPCFVQEVILLDRQRLVPHCAPEPAEPQEPTATPTSALPKDQDVVLIDRQSLVPHCAPELAKSQGSTPVRKPTPTPALSQGL